MSHGARAGLRTVGAPRRLTLRVGAGTLPGGTFHGERPGGQDPNVLYRWIMETEGRHGSLRHACSDRSTGDGGRSSAGGDGSARASAAVWGLTTRAHDGRAGVARAWGSPIRGPGGRARIALARRQRRAAPAARAVRLAVGGTGPGLSGAGG